MNDDSSFGEAVTTGQGNITLVFLHYFGGSVQSWQWLTQKLESKYRCVAINLPGFGGTKKLAQPSVEGFATYVQQVIEKLNIKNYVLVGHSMGGKVAVQVAINNKNTSTVQQLILLAPSPPSIERKPESEKQRMLNHPDMHEAENTVNGAIVQPLDKERFNIAVSTQLQAENDTWRWWIEEGMNHSIAEQAKILALPITVIASKDDPAVTYQMTQDDTMPNLPPHTRLISTNQVGHLYPLEAPGWLSELLQIVVDGK